MVENEEISRWTRLRRFLNKLNFFETDDTDENVITIQRWSTRIYICLLFICVCLLCIQYSLRVDDQLIEVKNPSMEIYGKLRNLHTDMNCPCSQISLSYDSFVTLTPIYHPICSSEFISQKWIEMLADQMTSLRYPGDFRATASTQFQALRELCRFSQSVISDDIEDFYHREFISATMLNEDRWRIETDATINAFLSGSYTNVKHKISFFRSFTVYNLFGSGIQTPITLLLEVKDETLVIIPERLFYQPYPDGDYCACDDGGRCQVPSNFYDIGMVNNVWFITYWLLQSYSSLALNDWSTGCWALESLFLSSFSNSFLNNQTQLNMIANYFNWPSNSIPTALNLQESSMKNISDETLDDLVQTSFVINMNTQLNYSQYFQQCQIESCSYYVKKHSSFLYIITSLLGLYGGLSVILKFLIPYIVTFVIKRCKCQRVTPVDNLDEPPRTWRQRTKMFIEHIWKKIVEFNLFESSARRDPFDIKQRQWTTRIFLLCFIVGVVTITFYAMLIVQRKSIQINSLDLNTVLDLQLENEFNSSLQCPCTQINIQYGKIIDLQPFYHQVCSSDFVSSSWLYYIRALLQVNRDLTLHRLDFRRSYQLFFLLNEICTLLNETIVSSLEEFEQTELVTSYLLSSNLFENQMNVIVKKFQSELVRGFLRFFQLTRNISYINQYYSDANVGPFELTWFYTTSFSINKYSGMNDNSSYTCSCANDINCKCQLGLYNREYQDVPKSLVPGMYRACFGLESLVQSTLECFYDQYCILNTTGFYEQAWFPTDFIPLNASYPSRFQTNDTIGTLLSELFIEYWNESLNYSSYFDLCQPVSCSYDIFRRNSVLESSTIVVGLIGGLSIFLRILIPFLVTIYVSLIYRRQQDVDSQTLPIRRRMLMSFIRIQNWLKQINVFDNPKKTTGNNIHDQRRATYVYLILLLLALWILIMYNSLVYFTDKFTLSNVSLDTYQQLQQQYDVDELDCPCSQVSITYSSFLSFECHFHPVCQSDFISDMYLQRLYEIYDALDIAYGTSNAYTFHGTVFAHFQTLRILCNLAKDTFNDARQQFLTSSFISASMIDNEGFTKQLNSSLNRFQSSLPNEFLSSFQFIRGMVQSNAFVSLYSTNWYPVFNNWQSHATLYMQPQSYNNCSCLTSSSCHQPSIPSIRGYVVGCTPLEALLRSTIECLYEQSCIDLFTSYLNASVPILMPINVNETRFLQNDTVERISEEMFIENCSSKMNYSDFFEECHPLSCTVTVNKRHNGITVATILLSLYGGLTVALKLITPIFVYSFYKILRRCQTIRQVRPRQHHS